MKIFKLGLAAGAAILAVSWIFNWLAQKIFPALGEEFKNTDLFRPWDDPLMSVYFAYPFILGLALAWIWPKVKNLFVGRAPEEKAKSFTFAYWIVATIPGMVITYSSFQLSFLMVAVWAFGGLFSVFAGAFVLAKMDR